MSTGRTTDDRDRDARRHKEIMDALRGTPAQTQAKMFAGMLAYLADTTRTQSDAAQRMLAGLPPEADMAAGPDHDPIHDSRPDASSLFSPAFVNIPFDVRTRARAERKERPLSDLITAWEKCGWNKMSFIPLIGEKAWVVREPDFDAALPHLGTALVAYSTAHSFVCRNYSTAFATIVCAELWVNCGMICDEGGHHMYNAVPVVQADDTVAIRVVEPQADQEVPGLDPARHYDGKRGFCLIV